MNVEELYERAKKMVWFEVDSTNAKMVARLVREGRAEYVGERVVCYGPNNSLRKKIRKARIRKSRNA